MKKLITFALLAAMILTCFAGCGIRQGTTGAVNSAENVAAAVAPASTWKEGLTAWDGSADSTWYNTTATSFEIADGADFRAFYETVRNSVDDFAGKTITLTSNIDLGGKAWAPIVSDTTGDVGAYFKGTFDGNDKVIGNFIITIDDTVIDDNYVKNEEVSPSVAVADAIGGHSLFGSIGAGATIKDVAVVEGEYIIDQTSMTSNTLGTIVAEANLGTAVTTISNVYSNCNVKASSGNAKAFTNVGGIVGKAKGSSSNLVISNCTYDGTIANIANGGDAYAGLVGRVNGSAGVEISGCSVTGTINSKQRTGAFVGYSESNTGERHVSMIDSQFTGVLSATGNMNGGLLGYQDKATPITIKNCTMAGDVTIGGRASGGLIGYANSSMTANISNCTVSGDIEITLNDSKNNGAAVFVGKTNPNCVLTITDCTFTADASLKVTCSPKAISGTDDNTCYVGVIGGDIRGNYTVKNVNLLGSVNIIHTSNVETVKPSQYAIIGAYDNSTKANSVTNVIENLASCTITEGKTIVWSVVDPVIVGYQTKANATAGTDVRFVAALGDIAANTGVGFSVSILKAGETTPVVKEAYVDYIYTSINGTDGVAATTYTAAGFYSDYLATLVIEGVPADYFAEGEFKDCEITITPFTATEAEGVVTPVNGAIAKFGTIAAA